MTIANITIVETYLSAKYAFDAVEDALRKAKKDVVKAVGGYGFIEGRTSDIEVGVQTRKTINEAKLLELGLTQAQIDACKVEGEAYPVLRVKPKKLAKAA